MDPQRRPVQISACQVHIYMLTSRLRFDIKYLWGGSTKGFLHFKITKCAITHDLLVVINLNFSTRSFLGSDYLSTTKTTRERKWNYICWFFLKRCWCWILCWKSWIWCCGWCFDKAMAFVMQYYWWWLLKKLFPFLSMQTMWLGASTDESWTLQNVFKQW